MSKSKRFWIAVIAIAVLVTGFLAWLYWREMRLYKLKHSEQQSGISSYATENSEQYLRVCIEESGGGVFAVFDCFIKSADANRNAQRSKHDLEAQQEMARWSYALLLVSMGGLIVSATGLGFLFWSLRQTRVAVSAAVESNKIAKEIAEIDRRPWVSIKEITVERIDIAFDTDRKKNVLVAKFNVAIRNTGRTPAMHADIRFVSHNVFGPVGFVSEMREALMASKAKPTPPIGRTIAPDAIVIEEASAHADIGVTLSDGTFIDDQTLWNFGVVITYMGTKPEEIFETLARYTVCTISELGLVTLRASDVKAGRSFGLKPMGFDTMT